SSFCGAAASLCTEYTLPDVSQTVIITRMAGRTPVPAREEIASLAAHHASMVVFLSAGMLEGLRDRLLEGGYAADTPVAIVYKASWPDEKRVVGTIGELPELARAHGISRFALILIGDFLGKQYNRSRLYDPTFAHGFRESGQ
ncbi:cobalt-precorrin-4/precorrin-4 C(11)-methyltransferase, partial [Anaerotruncus colihominis]|uniref:cobalt-precorrin-4/precorrin-4 C(11)-methyltransferase n=2 Tax=Anaerotruncus TaxID=244127 RepID=UPI0026EA3E3B